MVYALPFIAWLAFRVCLLEKQRILLINLLSGCLYRNKAQRREWQRAVDGHSYIKDDSTYIEAYGGSKFDMQLQIDAMKEVLRKIERDEAEARAKGLLPETSEAD